MHRRSLLSRVIFAATCLAVTSCGYAVETSNQDITFLTPGAQDAKCDVWIEKLRYQVFPPQTINIRKSPKDMSIKCQAPGNRVVDMDVPSSFSARSLWGTPAGMAWDYASDSMNHYPSVIAVDFTNVPTKPNLPPKHNNPDIAQPESYNLEEFSSGEPRLNRDRDHVPAQLIRREPPAPKAYDGGNAYVPDAQAEQEAKSTDKGSLMSIIERLHEQQPQSSQTAGEAGSAPVPIFQE